MACTVPAGTNTQFTHRHLAKLEQVHDRPVECSRRRLHRADLAAEPVVHARTGLGVEHHPRLRLRIAVCWVHLHRQVVRAVETFGQQVDGATEGVRVRVHHLGQRGTAITSTPDRARTVRVHGQIPRLTDPRTE